MNILPNSDSYSIYFFRKFCKAELREGSICSDCCENTTSVVGRPSITPFHKYSTVLAVGNRVMRSEGCLEDRGCVLSPRPVVGSEAASR